MGNGSKEMEPKKKFKGSAGNQRNEECLWLVSRLAKQRLCRSLKSVANFFLQKANGRHFKLSRPRGKIKDTL